MPLFDRPCQARRPRRSGFTMRAGCVTIGLLRKERSHEHDIGDHPGGARAHRPLYCPDAAAAPAGARRCPRLRGVCQGRVYAAHGRIQAARRDEQDPHPDGRRACPRLCRGVLRQPRPRGGLCRAALRHARLHRHAAHGPARQAGGHPRAGRGARAVRSVRAVRRGGAAVRRAGRDDGAAVQ